MSARSAQELTNLIERALRSIPYLRLDAVPSVSALFETAVDCLEANLTFVDDLDRSERRRIQPEPIFASGPFAAAQLEKMHGFESKQDDEKQKRNKKPAFVRPLSSDAGKTRVTRDYSSPSLGPRRIGSPSVAGASSRKKSALSQELSSSSSEEGSDDELVQPPARNLGLWKASKQQEDAKVDETGAARVDYSSPSLIPRRILEKKQEGTGASSRARGAVEDNKDDEALLSKVSMMSVPQANSSRLLVDLARTPGGSERVMTPKPAFLQRLDRPGGALAQLEQSKDALQRMLAHALTRVDHVKPASFELVYSKLLRAVEALEEGTTIASYRANEPPLPASSARKHAVDREER